jgi:polyferredoxin
MKTFRQAVNNLNIRRFRTIFQISAFLLIVYGGYLAIDLGSNVPTFTCVFARNSIGNCFLYGFQHRLSIPFDQIISFRGLAILISILWFLAWFIFLNKAWCGYVCPLGTLQDWITALRNKLKIPYSQYSLPAFTRLKKIKYILLALLILFPLGMSNSLLGLPKLSHEFSTAICMICPARVVLPLFNGDTSQLTVDFASVTKMTLTALGMGITGLFLAAAFIKRRFLCFFCPMSAFHYLFSKAGLMGLRKNGKSCTVCGNCTRVCDMEIREIADDVVSKNAVKDDCMMCFKCVAACPEEKCLQVTFLGFPIYEATETGFQRRQKQRENYGTETS